MWELTREETNYGIPKRRLRGHNHFVSDVVISSDGQFALSGSWDSTLRLWDLTSGQTTRRFVGHTKDVLSVAFSADNRQIVSGSRDRSIKLWNTLGVCKYTIQEEGHSDWVSCVRFSPNTGNPIIVSCGWDRIVKVWLHYDSFFEQQVILNFSFRFGTSPTASSVPITSGTPVIWIQWPCPLMVPCVPLVAKTLKLCFGTWMKENICTLWMAATRSTLSLSHPIDIGYVLPLAPALKFG